MQADADVHPEVSDVWQHSKDMMILSLTCCPHVEVEQRLSPLSEDGLVLLKDGLDVLKVRAATYMFGLRLAVWKRSSPACSPPF